MSYPPPYDENNKSMKPTGSFAPTFNPSLTQYHAAAEQPDFGASNSRDPLVVAPQNPPPKKAKNRRKRHVPPGPAGVWFQGATAAANVAAAQNTNGDDQNNNEEEEIIVLDDDDDGVLSSPNNNNTPSRRRRRRKKRAKTSDAAATAASDVSRCLAWTAMQQTLNLCTPYLPPYLSVMERYKQLRSYYNADKRCVLLPEIISSGGSNFASLQSRSLLVLVHAVQCHSYTDWTVELQDECGASIQAWLEPKFVQDEQSERQQGKSGSVQMGHVWLVQGASLFVSTNPSSTTNKGTEWWLLIQKENVKQVWTTQSSRDWSDQQHLAWMEQRRTMSSNHEVDVQSTPPEADEENSSNSAHNNRRSEERAVSAGSQQFGAPAGFEALFQQQVPRTEQQPQRRGEASAVVSATTAVTVPLPPPPVTAPSRPIDRPVAQVTNTRPNPYGKRPARSTSVPGSTVHTAPQQAATIDTPGLRQPKTIDFSQFVAPPPTQEETTPAIARTRPVAAVTTASDHSTHESTRTSFHGGPNLADTTRGLSPTSGSDAATARTPPPPKAPTARKPISTASKSPADNPLSQFCAVSAKKLSPQPDNSNTRSPPTQSANRASPKPTSARKKSKKKSPKPTPDAKSVSPKLASFLWSNMDESMLGMLDGDDEEDGVRDEDNSQTSTDRQASAAASKSNEPSEEQAPKPLEEQAPKPIEEHQQTSLLFQASAFDGVDLDDLFDED